MKKIKVVITLLALSASACFIVAQDNGGQQPPDGNRPPGGERHHRLPPPPPVMLALDVNNDGQIDATEIAQASDSLKKLDKNGDGILTRDEVCPPRPDGAEGFGGGRPRGPRPNEGQNN